MVFVHASDDPLPVVVILVDSLRVQQGEDNMDQHVENKTYWDSNEDEKSHAPIIARSPSF
jgi:hypothetical protein